MHVVFVDIVYGYTVDRPLTDKPLGGTTSAICFLAKELAQRGVKVTLVNALPARAQEAGIETVPLDQIQTLCQAPSVTAFVFCGRWNAEMVALLRPLTRAPFIAWMHEVTFKDKFVQPLPAFQAYLFVSEWQARINAGFLTAGQRVMLLRNAMHPAFADLWAEGDDLMAAKSKPPVILYAGDYQRGAMHVPLILKGLCALESDFTVAMYTDPSFSPDPSVNQACVDALQQHYRVTHIGKVGQIDLAQAMKQATIFLSPNPWPETSCINLIQAMAAGLWCLTSDRAALPETGHGFSQLVPIEEKNTVEHFGMPVDVKGYAVHLALALRAFRDNPAAWGVARQKQRTFFLDHYQWSQRAQPFIDFLSDLAAL